MTTWPGALRKNSRRRILCLGLTPCSALDPQGALHRSAFGLLNGPHNYAASVRLADGSDEIYEFVCLDALDADELPKPGAETLQLLVHELAHSYVNPVVDAHAGELEAGFSKLFVPVQKNDGQAGVSQLEDDDA